MKELYFLLIGVSRKLLDFYLAGSLSSKTRRTYAPGEQQMKGTKSVISDENKKLCVWLKRQRQEKGHTMRSLSEILGTPHSFIGKVENQERRLDVIEYVRYCHALEIDPMEGLKQVLTDA
ncbi:helix-turn-helix domain-containing protein [Rheinheimera sp.]|uniref:helix-turn-helix domain-containing protein n=1 Tax=Rheinheimera sp. TaxID=1869214 RepID=UPI003AF84FCE